MQIDQQGGLTTENSEAILAEINRAPLLRHQRQQLDMAISERTGGNRPRYEHLSQRAHEYAEAYPKSFTKLYEGDKGNEPLSRQYARKFFEHNGNFPTEIEEVFKKSGEPCGHRTAEIAREIIQMAPEVASKQSISVKEVFCKIGIITEKEVSLEQSKIDKLAEDLIIRDMNNISGRYRYERHAEEFFVQKGKFLQATIDSFGKNGDPSGHRAAEIRYEIMQMTPIFVSLQSISVENVFYSLHLINEAERSFNRSRKVS